MHPNDYFYMKKQTIFWAGGTAAPSPVRRAHPTLSSSRSIPVDPGTASEKGVKRLQAR